MFKQLKRIGPGAKLSRAKLQFNSFNCLATSAVYLRLVTATFSFTWKIMLFFGTLNFLSCSLSQLIRLLSFNETELNLTKNKVRFPFFHLLVNVVMVFSNTHLSIAKDMPVRSAAGKKSFGMIIFPSLSFKRTNTSYLSSVSPCKLMIGWKYKTKRLLVSASLSELTTWASISFWLN